MLAIHDTARLRGYLSKSVQAGLSCIGTSFGSGNVSGATRKAHAMERRASSRRPWVMSQWGDSGTQPRITSVKAAGSNPIRNKPRQPMVLVKNAAKEEAIMTPSADTESTITAPPAPWG